MELEKLNSNLEKRKSEYSFDKKIDQDVLFQYGVKEKNPIGGELYDVYSLSYNASRMVTFKSRLGLGLDFFYNTSLRGELDENGEPIENPSDIMQWGISAFYALQVSKFFDCIQSRILLLYSVQQRWQCILEVCREICDSGSLYDKRCNENPLRGC